MQEPHSSLNFFSISVAVCKQMDPVSRIKFAIENKANMNFIKTTPELTTLYTSSLTVENILELKSAKVQAGLADVVIARLILSDTILINEVFVKGMRSVKNVFVAFMHAHPELAWELSSYLDKVQDQYALDTTLQALTDQDLCDIEELGESLVVSGAKKCQY